MKKVFTYALLLNIYIAFSQTDSGNLESYLEANIAAMPGETGNDFKIPENNDMIAWENSITALLANDIETARTQASLVNYQIVEYTDTEIGNNDIFYIVEEKLPQINYWGTFAFAKNADRPNLILQAPHADFDTNSGEQAVYSFVRLNNKALFLNGTHRCNHDTLSTCAGTTKVCNDDVSQAFKISDMAHNTDTVWQKTTEIIYNTIATSVFFQFHGFSKKDDDPYVILSNGTDETPKVDYATQLKTALKAQDNTLTFKIAHLDNWDRLVGFTNTQGRLINGSNNPCNLSAQNTSGRFLHIEQEKEKLREDSTGWNKMYLALSNIFTIPTSTWLGNTTDWNTASNWSLNAIPLATDNLIIPDVPNKPIINSNTNALANNITIDENSTVTIENGGSLIIEGFATVNGEFIYNLNVNDDKWHLISSPVKLAEYNDAWNSANNIATNLPNEAIASYINTSDKNGDWVYFQDGGESSTFEDGIGYSIKRTIAGNYRFSGTIPSSPITTSIKANNIGDPNSENRWTLIGNPFPSYLNIETFLSTNSSPLNDTHESVYVWNANAGESGEYQPLTTGHIAPGQGFFVSSEVDSTSVSFTKEMLSKQNGMDLYRSSNTKIILSVSNNSETKSTEINFIKNKTTGLDPRFDIGTFTGQSSTFSLYTQLVTNNEGINFMKQTLPSIDNHNFEIPIGIIAKADNEIEFKSEISYLPENIRIVLEDRLTNKFVELNQNQPSYKINLTENLNGIGRFYLRVSNKTLKVKETTIENVSIYKTNLSSLRIIGLKDKKTNMKFYDILGKEILDSTFISNGVKDISLPILTRGIYFVVVKTDNIRIKKKIVLE